MHITLLPEGWPRPKGYANGIMATGQHHIFCGGQIGWLPDGRSRAGISSGNCGRRCSMSGPCWNLHRLALNT